jgi:hypothetical protein
MKRKTSNKNKPLAFLFVTDRETRYCTSTMYDLVEREHKYSITRERRNRTQRSKTKTHQKEESRTHFCFLESALSKMEEVQLNDSENRKTIKRTGSGNHGSSSNLRLLDHGEIDTLEYRIRAVEKATKHQQEISLWHDVTLVHIDPASERPTPYLNFVCEIPKYSRKKYEIATNEVGNPIKQDEKKGVLREVSM